MIGEPEPNISIEEMQQKIASMKTTQELVDAYVIACYKFKFFEDAEYDYEEDTEEYEKACSATDAWSEIMDRLEEKVRETAASEGLFDLIPSNETIEQIEPFMNKYGYINAKGWWVKDS